MKPSDVRGVHAACRYGTASGVAQDIALFLAECNSAAALGIPFACHLSVCSQQSGISEQQLRHALQADPCFGLHADSSGQAVLALNVKKLFERAKEAASTGTLLSQLPPPTAYVADVHPVRPGWPQCKLFTQTGSCHVGRDCAFTHPSEAYKGQHSGSLSTSHSTAASGFNAALVLPGLSNSPRPHTNASPSAAAIAAQPDAIQLKQTLQTNHKPCEQRQQQQQLPQRPGYPTCVMYMLRGICVAGSACPNDHPPSGSNMQAPAMPFQAQPQHNTPADDCPLALDVPNTPRLPSGQAATAVNPGKDQQKHGHQQGKQQQQHIHPQQDAPAALAGHHAAQQDHVQRRMYYVQPAAGWTVEGLPKRPGGAICTFYSHTGTCAFKKGCIYHHPDPEALLVPIRSSHTGLVTSSPQPHVVGAVPLACTAGFMAARVSADKAMPYARFVSHLARLWEYTSCPEAQMKTWLARHLLALGNPGCQMWSKSAAAVAAFDDGSNGVKPYGRYSCLLSEAGLLLKAMWQQQPGVEEMGPMPHVGAKVLGGDPYFEVLPDPNNSSQLHVKLNFNKIKATLNW